MWNQQQPQRTQWTKTHVWILSILLSLFVLFGFIIAVSGKPEKPEVIPMAERNSMVVESEEPKSTPGEVEALWMSMLYITHPSELLQQEGYANDSSSPLYAIIPGWSGYTDSFIRIQVQETLTEASTKKMCINILNLVGPTYKDLSGIVFTDNRGLDHNCFRRDAPGADWVKPE